MGAGFLGGSGQRFAEWKRRHPKFIVGGLLTLALLLAIAGWWSWSHFAAESRLQAVRAAVAQRDWIEAESDLDSYQRLRPNDPAGLLLAAKISRRRSRLNEAKAEIDAAEIRLGYETMGVKVERALLRLQRGDLDGTEEFLRDAVNKDPDDAVEILDLLSEALIRDLRVADAQACLDELLRRNPDDFDMLVRHGFAADSQGLFAVAAESLKKAVALRPEAQEARLSLVQALITSAQYDEARKHLTELRRTDPKNPAVQFAQARCMAYQGEKEQAAKLLDEMIAAEPDNPLLLGERGWISLELDRPAEAEPLLRRAKSHAPHDKAILTHLANCLRLLGKPDEARPLLDEAKRITEETQKTSLLNRQILEEKPKTPQPYYELGAAYARLDQQKLALHYLQKALQKDPRYAPAHEALAALYKSVGDYDRAAIHRQQAEAK